MFLCLLWDVINHHRMPSSSSSSSSSHIHTHIHIHAHTYAYIGGIRIRSTPKVIVDVREFRSSLPSFLYQRGMQVIPVTLEVGDYVLSPDICIERKALTDLIQSLSSGRLYNQMGALCRFYRSPCLLIELDSTKAFALQVGVSPCVCSCVRSCVCLWSSFHHMCYTILLNSVCRANWHGYQCKITHFQISSIDVTLPTYANHLDSRSSLHRFDVLFSCSVLSFVVN